MNSNADAVSRFGPIVICDNLERKCNIAAMLRICSSIECAALLLVRDSAAGRRYPKDSTIFHEAGQEARAFWSEGRGRYVLLEEVAALLPAERVVFAVDTAPGAVDLFHVGQSTRKVQSCFIFGNESEGISKPLLSLCDGIIYIPSPGCMKSLNASQSAVVVLFEWLRQSTRSDGSQALLQQVLAMKSTKAVHEGDETQNWFNFFSRDNSVPGMNSPGSGPLVICDNLPTSNRGGIGAMIRLCCNMDCAGLLLLQDSDELPKESSILRASAQGQTFWKEGRGRFVKDVEELQGLLPAERVVYGVQAGPGAVDVFEDLFRHETRQPCFIFSGPEGLSEALLSLCDALIYVPCPGRVKSLHVSQSAAVVLFQWLRQKTQVPAPSD